MDVVMGIASSAQIHDTVAVPQSAQIWDLAQIREGVLLGEEVTIGRGVYIGPKVTIGNRSKIQNYSQIFDPARIADGVFIGPMAILTNDRLPRAVTPEGSRKSSSDWDPVGVEIEEGASIGAGVICVAPVHIGKWAMIAAGSVVTRDVPDFALMIGSPATQNGWVGKSGFRLSLSEGQADTWVCPKTGRRYKLRNDRMVEL
jgi:UDP-2-acetamido-3-amino-2,3-dideoxy-glucuronate N-acetyltransferase